MAKRSEIGEVLYRMSLNEMTLHEDALREKLDRIRRTAPLTTSVINRITISLAKLEQTREAHAKAKRDRVNAKARDMRRAVQDRPGMADMGLAPTDDLPF